MLDRVRSYLVEIVLLVLLGLLWWGISYNQSTGSAGQLKLGGAFGLTGMAAEWGVAEQNGVLLALEEFRGQHRGLGRQVVLISEDIGSEQVRAVNAVQKLINVDKVAAIVGATWLDTFGGAAPLADQFGVIMITPSALITALQGKQPYHNIFSTWYRAEAGIETVTDHLVNTGRKRVVLFFGNDPFWQNAADYLRQAVPAKGGTVIKEYKFTTEFDFRTPLHELKRLKPDAIFFGLNDEKGLFNFLKQRQEIYPQSALYTTESFESVVYRSEYKGLTDNIYLVASAAADPQFAARYKKRFGTEPVFSATNAYDAANMILAAWAAGKRTATELRDYLRTETHQTVTFGAAKFDQLGGLTGGKFLMKVVKDGELKLIE